MEVNLSIAFKEWLQFSDGGKCLLPAGVQFYGVAHNGLLKETHRDGIAVEDWDLSKLRTGESVIRILEVTPFKFMFSLFVQVRKNIWDGVSFLQA